MTMKLSKLLWFPFLTSVLLLPLASYAQEEDENKTIDLPPVKIEVLDTTELSIPKEKFRAFTEPEYDIYVTLGHKERLWYITPTSPPSALPKSPDRPKEDFLLSFSAYPGLPTALTYQALFIKSIENFQTMVEVSRKMFQSPRSAKLASDPTKHQGNTSRDDLNTALAYRNERTNIRTDLSYNAKDLAYLSGTGERFANERSAISGSFSWIQKYYEDVESNLNLDVSELRLNEPITGHTDTGLNTRTSLDVRTFFPRLNPINLGGELEHFSGSNVDESFTRTMLKLYVQDRYIRLPPFAVGVGLELALDTYKSSLGEEREFDLYPNPYLLLTAQTGQRATLQLGLERTFAKRTLTDIYFDNEYTVFNPSLKPESFWNLFASLKYSLFRRANMTINLFDREISNLLVFNENKLERSRRREDTIFFWKPESLENARILGINIGLELSIIGNKVNQRLEYTHEFHETPKFIKYRPKDRGSLTISFPVPYDMNALLSCDLFGKRVINEEQETLPGYMLLRSRVLKTFSRNVTASLEVMFYLGKGDYQVWEQYKLPETTVDFGITVKF